jgi:hypothetical protein
LSRRSFGLGARDEGHCVGDILFGFFDRIGDRLHDGDAEGHALTPGRLRLFS